MNMYEDLKVNLVNDCGNEWRGVSNESLDLFIPNDGSVDISRTLFNLSKATKKTNYYLDDYKVKDYCYEIMFSSICADNAIDFDHFKELIEENYRCMKSILESINIEKYLIVLNFHLSNSNYLLELEDKKALEKVTGLKV